MPDPEEELYLKYGNSLPTGIYLEAVDPLPPALFTWVARGRFTGFKRKGYRKLDQIFHANLMNEPDRPLTASRYGYWTYPTPTGSPIGSLRVITRACPAVVVSTITAEGLFSLAAGSEAEGLARAVLC